MLFFHTNVSKENVAAQLEEVWNTTRLSEGQKVKEFEQKLQEALSLPRTPVAVNSGTSGLHLALAVAGIGMGDEVILPAQTFIATGLAILMQGAKPVFADINPLTGNICPKSIRAKITPKTKAIMPVHWAGLPCDMDEILQLAEEHGLLVIEDAAHALVASYKGRPIGGISDFTVFSFQATKHLTTGDGGAICCLQERHETELRKRRWFDIDREKAWVSLIGERVYDAQSIGYKYHMNDVAAAIGLGNFGMFETTLRRHREIAAFYKEHLYSVPGIELLSDPPDRISSYLMFPILVEQRERFAQALSSQGIPLSVVHRRIDRSAVFGGVTQGLTGQELFDQRQIALPAHRGLSSEDLHRIAEVIRTGW